MDRRQEERVVPERDREAEVRAILRDAEESGLPRAEYCRRRGLNRGTLSWWKHQIQKKDRERDGDRLGSRRLVSQVREGGRASPVQWVRLTVKDSSPSPSGSALEVILTGGRTVRVAQDFDEKTLVRLIQTLEGVSC